MGVSKNNKKKANGWPLDIFIALRLLGARRRSYVSLVSSVAMWGLAVGVASLIVVFSVTSGFENVFRDKILGIYPHLVVIGMGGDLPDWRDVQKTLSGEEDVASVSPATYDEMMASAGGRRSPAIVKGLETQSEALLAQFAPLMTEGKLSDLGLEPELAGSSADGFTVGPFPGGGDYLLVVRETKEPVLRALYHESGDQPWIAWWSLLEEPTTLEMPGPFVSRFQSIEPGKLTAFEEASKEGTEALIGDFPYSSPMSKKLHVFFPYGEEDVAGVLRCELDSPRGSREPAQICVVNATPSRIDVALPDGKVTVQPFESLTSEVTSVHLPRVVLGEELAREIEVSVGDVVRLVSPLSSLPGSGRSRGPSRSIADEFEVSGTIQIGFYEYDSELALIDFGTALRFLHQGDVARWLEVRVTDLLASEEHRIAISRALSRFSLLNLATYLPVSLERFEDAAAVLPEPANEVQAVDNLLSLIRDTKFSNSEGQLAFGSDDSHRVITWQEMNKPLFSSMKRQRIVLSLFFLIIIIVAAFNVVSSQVMIVREKGGNIAILKAMGATDGQVSRVFLYQGLALGVLGVTLGLLLGFGICGLLIYVGFPLDPKVYLVSRLPVDISIRDVALSCILSLASIYVAVSVAAKKAAQKQPVDGLRELE